MSIVASARTLASRRKTVLMVVGVRMYGRVERTSSGGVRRSGSAATRRSYLSDHFDHRVGPVPERVLLDDTPPQLGAGHPPNLASCRSYREQHLAERGRIVRRSEERQGKIAEQRLEECVRRHDGTRARRGLE